MIDYKPYILNEEQVKAIKNGDQNAINNFYFDNLDLFITMSKSFISKNKYFIFDSMDLLHQIYLDIPKFNFSNKIKLYYSIKKCFLLVGYGGYKLKNTDSIVWNKYQCPLYAKNKDNEEFLITDYLFIHEVSVAEDLELKEEFEEQVEKVLNIINNMSIPSRNREKEVFILKLNILYGYSLFTIKENFNDLWKQYKSI